MDVTLGSETPDLPTEVPRDSFTAEPPCLSNDEKHYDTLLPWWREWLTCNNARVRDSNMVVTNGDIPGGGYSEVTGDDGTVSSGAYLGDLPSDYTKYHGKTDAFKAMAATLHEVGHNLMIQGGSHHQRGNTFDTPVEKVNTPMGPVDGSYNKCNDPHDGSQNNVAMHWANCGSKLIERYP